MRSFVLLLAAVVLAGCAGASSQITVEQNVYASPSKPSLRLDIDRSFKLMERDNLAHNFTYRGGANVPVRIDTRVFLDVQEKFLRRMLSISRQDVSGKWQWDASSAGGLHNITEGVKAFAEYDFKYAVNIVSFDEDSGFGQELVSRGLTRGEYYLELDFVRNMDDNRIFEIVFLRELDVKSVLDEQGHLSQAKLYAQAMDIVQEFDKAVKVVN